MSQTKKYFRILSIDGGGVRGIIPGQVLVALENKLQKKLKDPTARIGQYFDLIAGTSTGGIISCMLTCPTDETRDAPKEKRYPKFTTEEIARIYTDENDKIFSAPFWHTFLGGRGLFDAKYPTQQYEQLIEEKVGDIKISQLVADVLITSFNIDDGHATFFTSSDAVEKNRDYYIRDVVRSTSAAPTFFSPHKASQVGMPDTERGYIDGGVFANNPTMCALVEAYKMDTHLHQSKSSNFHQTHDHSITNDSLEDVFVLSLGTSDFKAISPYEDAKGWGILGWLKPLINTLMSGVSETVSYQAYQLFRLLRIKQVEATYQFLKKGGLHADQPRMNELEELRETLNSSRNYSKKFEAMAFTTPQPQYIRINPSMGGEETEMDDTSALNINNLVNIGQKAAKDYDKLLDLTIEMITK